MKGVANSFVRKDQAKLQMNFVQYYAKSNSYREQLQPFIGNCIEVVAQHWYSEQKLCDNKNCTVVLLKDLQIVKVPAKSRHNLLPQIDHLWVHLNADWSEPENTSNGLWLRGFVYEYVSNGKRNIGFQVVSARGYQSK